ncbi:MAG: hypothetical protein WCO02_07560 [Bacteroidota bacterium]
MTKTSKRIKISLLIIVGIILLALISAFLYAYIGGSKALKQYLTETLAKQTKGLYRMDIKDLDITLIPGWISIKGVTLTPDTARYRHLLEEDSAGSVLFTVRISKIQVRGVDFISMVRKKKIEIGQVIIADPAIEIDLFKINKKKEEPKAKQKLKLQINLPPAIQSLNLDEIRLSKGSLKIRDHKGDSLKETYFPSITFEVDNIHTDQSGLSDNRLFNADDIRLIIAGYSMNTSNGMNSISLGELSVSTGKSQIKLKKFSLKPLLGRKEYAKSAGFQTDQMTITIDSITLSGLKLDTAILNGKILVKRLAVNGLQLEDFRDQSYPRKPGLKPPLPQDMIPKIPVKFFIDTVSVDKSKVIYSERKKAGPGTVFFNDLSGKLYPLTNDSLMLQQSYTMHLDGAAMLMGKGKIKASFAFKVPDKNSRFTLSATVGPMDLREFNQVVTPLAGISITSGKLIKMEIPTIEFNKEKSTGLLKFYYSSLEIKLIKKDTTDWSSIKSSVLGWAANTYVSSDNPRANGKFKEGIILWHRDQEKSIFNYLWKSVFTGLKSTVGINNKEQKAIKKERKKK